MLVLPMLDQSIVIPLQLAENLSLPLIPVPPSVLDALIEKPLYDVISVPI